MIELLYISCNSLRQKVTLKYEVYGTKGDHGEEKRAKKNSLTVDTSTVSTRHNRIHQPFNDCWGPLSHFISFIKDARPCQ
jgi:hypothetical protein